MKIRTMTAMILCLASGAAFGCSGGNEPVEAATGTTTEPETQVDVTVIDHDEHGELRTTQHTITRAQQEAMNAARAEYEASGGKPAPKPAPPAGEPGLGEIQSDIHMDTFCDFTSLWLYSQPNRTGSMLCLAGSGNINLANVCYTWTPTVGAPICTANWSDHVRSFWAGQLQGKLTKDTLWGCDSVCASFYSYAKPADDFHSCGTTLWASQFDASYRGIGCDPYFGPPQQVYTR